MEHKQVQLDQRTFSCSICLDLLRQPVAVPCGHSYCKNCIKTHWNGEEQQKKYSCPQCRQTFTPRPVLVKNTMLAALVEELKKTGKQGSPTGHKGSPAGQQGSPAGHQGSPAGPKDVACDFCTGKKLRATKSCLQCLVSYCDQHLQPHFTVAQFKEHKLVQPSKQLQENICSLHNEVMKMFCRTDQQLICRLCSKKQHKGHDTVSAAAERGDRQKELQETRHIIQLRIRDTDYDLVELQEEVQSFDISADEAVEESGDMFNHLISLLEERHSRMKQQIISQQKILMSRVREPQKKMEQDLAELKMEDAELKQLSNTHDHIHFLRNYPSLSAVGPSTHSSTVNICPATHFEGMTAPLGELSDKLRGALMDKWSNVSLALSQAGALQSAPHPNPQLDVRPDDDRQPLSFTGAEFLRCSQKFTLDPNTANTRLLLSEQNRRVTALDEHQPYPQHSDRFTHWSQVLSREGLNERCYFEVEWSGREVCVALAYKSNGRALDQSLFGFNDRSCVLECNPYRPRFRVNNVAYDIPGPLTSRVGVYVDQRAGRLYVVSITNVMVIYFEAKTTFTEPLYVGFRCREEGASAEFVDH